MEMPYLQEVHEEQSDEGLHVYLINIAQQGSTVSHFAEAFGLTMPILLDQRGNIASRYNVGPIPTTFFIASDGVIQAVKVGAFRNKSELETWLGSIM
jgi:peroxiredoxin